MAAKRKLSRRTFLQWAGVAAAGAAMTACQPKEVQVVQTKEVQVVQTKEVVQTKVVEKAVTATPIPAIKTVHGKVMPADAAPLDKQVYYENAAEPKHLDVVRDLYMANVVLNFGAEPWLRRDENQNLVPALAESYKAAPDASYFDFVLRKDAKWSDGQPITADDAVFTFRHLSDPTLDNTWNYFYDVKGVQAHREGKGKAEDVGVQKIDDRTVHIIAQTPAPHLPALLAYQGAVLAPKHKAEKNPAHWADTVEGFVSSGQFKLVKWDHNKALEWEINPYYNGPHPPYVQKVIQPIGAGGGQGLFNAWLNKEIDVYSQLQPAELARARSDHQLNPLLHFYNNFQSDYLSFDTMNPPLNNLKLRQALSHAIDRETMCSQVLNGIASPGYSMLPPGFPAYNPELKKVQTYDVELAKKLLAEAGYKDGKDTSGKQLTLELFSNGREAKLEYVQDQWQRNLGIKVNMTILENTVWKTRRGAHDMMVYKGPYEYDYIDPANLLTMLWKSTSDKGSPRHAWRSTKFDDLCLQAGKEGDEKKRIALYQEAERLLVEDVAAVFISHMVIFQIWWPYLQGIKPDKDGNVVFRGLDISRYQMYIRNDIDQYRKPR